MKKIFTILLLSSLIINSNTSSAQSSGLTRDQQLKISGKSFKPVKHSINSNLPMIHVSKSSSSACDSLTTLFAQNNGLDGAMFNLIAHNDITLSYLYANISVDEVFNIYYKHGSYIGFENDSNAWTLAGSLNVVANGVDTPSMIPLNLNLSITAGDTIGMYFVTPGSSSVRYTDATSGNEGDVYVDNSDLAITLGSGVSWPFDFVIGPRIWNGSVLYCTGTTGINELNNSAGQIFPNPFTDQTTFHFKDDQQRIIEIYNLSGQIVKSIFADKSSVEINREDLSDGLYTYRIISEKNSVETGKLVIN